MLKRTKLRFKYGCLLAGITALSAIPALAETPVFGTLTLSPGFKPSDGVVSGYTSGSTSLPAIVANQDRSGNKCLGFADNAPDYKMTLQKDFPKLTIQVDSGGKDTTLAIKGPDGTVRCADDTGKNKDASIQDTGWKSGEYQIWVGSIDAGSRWKYKLSVQQ